MFLNVCALISASTHPGAVPTYPIEGQYIREWLILGPFEGKDLEQDFLASVSGEARVSPKEGDTVTTEDGRTLTWKRYRSGDNWIDLRDAIGDYEYVTAYAFCLLQSEREGDGAIYLGSDDGAAVWMNGKRVHYNPGGGAMILDSDRFEIPLNVGENRCLVKIYQDRVEWTFTAWVFPPTCAIIEGKITDETTASRAAGNRHRLRQRGKNRSDRNRPPGGLPVVHLSRQRKVRHLCNCGGEGKLGDQYCTTSRSASPVELDSKRGDFDFWNGFDA